MGEKVLVIEGGKSIYVDSSEYNPLGVESGIPSEITSTTSQRRQKFTPPYATDMFGKQDTSQFDTKMQYAANLQRTHPDRATELFASEGMKEQIRAEDERRKEMRERAEQAGKGLVLPSYQIMYQGKGQQDYTGTEDIHVRGEDGEVLRRNSVVKSSFLPDTNILSRSAPVYKEIFFRHWENEDAKGNKIPTIVPLRHVTLGEAQNTAGDYVNSIRQTGGVSSGRGTYFKSLKGYTKPGIRNLFTGSVYTGETHTIIEQLYSAPVPIVSSVIKGVTTEIADIAGGGTGAKGVHFLAEMEKNFWEFMSGSPNEKEAVGWYRDRSVHDIERLLEKDDATSEFLLGDFLGENLGFTYLALRGTRIIPKGIRSFDDYTHRAIQVERNNIKRRLRNNLEYKSANQADKKAMVDDALNNTNGVIILQTSRKLLQKDIDIASKGTNASWKFLTQAYKRAKYDIGASPNRFRAVIAVEELAFAEGQRQVGKDSELGGIGRGLLYAFATPASLNTISYLGAYSSLALVSRFQGIAELFGGDPKALNTVFDAIARNVPDGEFTALVQKGIIAPKARKAAIKLYRGMSQMPIEYQAQIFDEAKSVREINTQLLAWVDEMATTNAKDGSKVVALADNSIFREQFGKDATVEDIKKQFSFTIGQSFQIDILTLAESALLEQARIGATIDYNFFAHGKLLERKQEALHSLTKFLDVVDARFEKSANSLQFNEFIGKLNQQVNTTTNEINNNVVHITNIVETQLRRTLNKSADVPYSKTDIDEIDNLLDSYTNLRIVSYKSANAEYTPEDILRIRKEGTANKLIVRRKKISSSLQKNIRADADLVKANEAGASDYISMVDAHKIMASDRYDEALDGVNGIFLDDALPLLQVVRNNASSTLSELYRGRDASNLVRTIDKMYEPIMRKKVDEFYGGLVGVRYGDGADEVWESADEVEEYFQYANIRLGDISSFEKFGLLAESANQMDLLRAFPENKDIIPEDFDFLKLELRVDDLDNLMVGLTNELGTIDNLVAGAQGQKQRKLAEVMTTLKTTLDNQIGIVGESREVLTKYNAARDFYRNSSSPVLYESEITDWIMNTKRRKKVSKQFPTGFEHVNNISGKGNNEGYFGFIWDQMKADPDKANANLRKILGVYDSKTGSHVYVTDEMIRQAKAGPTGQGGTKILGHTAEELELIQTSQKSFAFNLQDWFVDKFKRNMLADPEMPVGFELTKIKTKEGDIVYNFYEIADRLEEVTSKDGSTIVSDKKFKGLLSRTTRDLLGNGVMLDNVIDKELFNSDFAIQLRKKLNNYDKTDMTIVRDLADATSAVERAKISLGTSGTKYIGKIQLALDHQNIIQKTIGGLSGSIGDSTDSMFRYLVMNPQSSFRIDELKDFLVNGTVTARMEGIQNSGKFTFTRPKKLMSEEEFKNAMGKFLAQGLRREATLEVRISDYTKFGIIPGKTIGDMKTTIDKGFVQRGVDQVKLMNILDDHKEILEPYINIGAMRLISAVGNILTPRGAAMGANIMSPTTGAARFTPASWISRFYAANSGRTSYRYIGAEAVVASLLRHEGAVTLALLESPEAQIAIAKMFAEGKMPTQKIGHATYAWLPNLVARVAQIVGEEQTAPDPAAKGFELIHKNIKQDNSVDNQVKDLFSRESMEIVN